MQLDRTIDYFSLLAACIVPTNIMRANAQGGFQISLTLVPQGLVPYFVVSSARVLLASSGTKRNTPPLLVGVQTCTSIAGINKK